MNPQQQPITDAYGNLIIDPSVTVSTSNHLQHFSPPPPPLQHGSSSSIHPSSSTNLPSNIPTTTTTTTTTSNSLGSPIIMSSSNSVGSTPQQQQQQLSPLSQAIQQQQQYGCIGYDSPKLPIMNPTFHLDIKTHPFYNTLFNNNLNLNTNNSINYLEGLCKPAISPYLNFNNSSNGYLCMVGTENQNQLSKNGLILSKIESPNNQFNNLNNNTINNLNNSNNLNILKIQPIEEHLRYIEWLPKDPRRIIIAANGELGIVILNEELNDINVIDIFPKFHHDTIRQFAINPVNQSLVISGGFDEKVFVTDISKLVDDIQTNQVKSENSVYLCQDVVSCVRFHPSDSNVASATTDQGVLHVFDVRTGNTSKPAFVYDTSKYDLFTHVYLDDFTVCLGYGDGSIQVHDIRTGKTLISFIDKAVNMIGDFIYEPQKKLLISLGMNKFSVYQVNSNNFELIHSAFNQQQPCVTNGNYLSEINQFITTDTFGHINLYDL